MFCCDSLIVDQITQFMRDATECFTPSCQPFRVISSLSHRSRLVQINESAVWFRAGGRMWRGHEGEEPDVCGALVRLAGQPLPFKNSRGREVWRPCEEGERAGTAAAVFRPLSRYYNNSVTCCVYICVLLIHLTRFIVS